MYLSLNNIKNIIFHSIIAILLVFLQVFSPHIWINSNLSINIDVLLIYLTYLCFNFKLYKIIIFAFFIGLFQDFVINIQMIGFFSLIKSLAVFFIGSIKKYNFLWSKNIKLIFLYFIYFVHFFLYYYLIVDNNYLLVLFISIIQSLVCLIIFYIVNLLVSKSSIIK